MTRLPQQQGFGRSKSSCENSDQEESVVTTVPARFLPEYDVSRTTAIFCITGLIFTWLVVIACLIATILVIKLPRSSSKIYFPLSTTLRYIRLSTTASEVLSFTINILVALITDSLGYIHGTSLRWALYREDRLHFNTNIRLFTSAGRSTPNRWPANALCMASLILCYAATSQLLIKGPLSNGMVSINGMAIAALGFSLICQAAVAS